MLVETELYYSKRKSLRSLFVLLPLELFFAWLIIQTGHWFGCFAIVFLGLFTVAPIIQIITKKPGVVFSQKKFTIRRGLFLQVESSFSWADIRNERITSKTKFAYRGYYTLRSLEFEYVGKMEQLVIDDFTLDRSEILRLFTHYKEASSTVASVPSND